MTQRRCGALLLLGLAWPLLILCQSAIGQSPVPGQGPIVGQNPAAPGPAASANAATTRPVDPELARLEQQPLRRRGSDPADPNARTGTTDDWSYTRTALALAGVIAVIFGLRYVAQRYLKLPSPTSAGAVVSLLGTTPLGPRQQLMLVQVGRRLLVVAGQGGQLSSLCEITDPDEIAEMVGRLNTSRSRAGEGAFSSLFARVAERFGAAQRTERALDYQAADAVVTPQSHGPAADPADAQATPTPAQTSEELSRLMQKVKALAQQFKP